MAGRSSRLCRLDGGVDLHPQADLAGGVPAPQGQVVDAGTPRKASWRAARGPVDRQRDGPRAGLVQAAQAARVSVGVPDGDTATGRPAAVPARTSSSRSRPLERVATGDDEQRRRGAERGDLRISATASLGGQLGGSRDRAARWPGSAGRPAGRRGCASQMTRNGRSDGSWCC